MTLGPALPFLLLLAAVALAVLVIVTWEEI